eukprot:CAMPEP_0185748598 /NCGR_PEP_ID=MMETSP1174-20130828/7304_1 /TAXON_ID=35687 /ORGANISM="Dictyocha speculum, Strain CCMP1381" /LENGTH=310 /DNA_ID=CAMNT_0028424351 /DNA_START=210 /DNA_END=1141 /DNA_ORIENTATION=-
MPLFTAHLESEKSIEVHKRKQVQNSDKVVTHQSQLPAGGHIDTPVSYALKDQSLVLEQSQLLAASQLTLTKILDESEKNQSLALEQSQLLAASQLNLTKIRRKSEDLNAINSWRQKYHAFRSGESSGADGEVENQVSELSINGLGRRTVELKLPKIPETLVHKSSFQSEKQGLLPAGVRSLSYSTIEVSERFKDPEVRISLPSTSSPSMSVLTPERIDRWEVFWAEVYLILTVTALGMHITRVDPHVEVFSNMMFNGVYTWTYAACLCKYAVMSYPPSWPFRSAVALFTTGYAAFLLKYLAAYNHMDLPW